MLRGLGALLDDRRNAMGILNAALVSHKDPEALFMLAACQAYTGDDRALSSLTQAVENGYRVPAALKTNPWLSELRRQGRLDALIELDPILRQLEKLRPLLGFVGLVLLTWCDTRDLVAHVGAAGSERRRSGDSPLRRSRHRSIERKQQRSGHRSRQHRRLRVAILSGLRSGLLLHRCRDGRRGPATV